MCADFHQFTLQPLPKKHPPASPRVLWKNSTDLPSFIGGENEAQKDVSNQKVYF